MRYPRRLGSSLDRDEMIARRAAGTPINDGSGRIVRNGVIVSAQDQANTAATRARNAAFARQTGQYADRSGTINPDAEGQGTYDATMSGGVMAPASPVRRAPRGAGMGMDAGGSTMIAGQTLQRAYRDLGATRTDTREQKVAIAKAAGTFGLIRDDYNARNAAKGRVMDEAGNIAGMTASATGADPVRRTGGYLAPSDPNNPDSEMVQVGGEPAAPAPSPVLRVGPAFQSDTERMQGIANAKGAERTAATQSEIDMARALGITVEELRRRRSARRLGPSLSTPSA